MRIVLSLTKIALSAYVQRGTSATPLLAVDPNASTIMIAQETKAVTEGSVSTHARDSVGQGRNVMCRTISQFVRANLATRETLTRVMDAFLLEVRTFLSIIKHDGDDKYSRTKTFIDK